MRAGRLTKRERIVGTLTAVVVGGVALYLLAVEPAALKWMEVHRRARKAEAELALARSLIENKTVIEHEYAKLKGAIASADTEQTMKVSLLSEVENLMRSCGLETSYVKPTVVVRERDFHRCGVELQGHCEGHQFVKLLQSLQEPKHLLRADLVRLVAGRGEPPLTVTLKVSKLARLEKP